MSDLMTLRVARAPQRRVGKRADDIAAYPDGNSEFVEQLFASANPRSTATAKLAERNLLPPTEKLGFLSDIDVFLNTHDNAPKLEELYAFFKIDEGMQPMAQIEAWLKERNGLRLIIADALVASLFVDVMPMLRAELVRLLTIFGFLEKLADNPSRFTQPQRIENALRWRQVVLPDKVLQVARRLSPPGRAVTRQGVADLFVVRNEWIRYDAGEIAHIENVLPYELKERKHVRLDESEVTQTNSTESTTSNERETQSTDRFELKDESSRDVELAVHAEAQIDTNGQYGPTKVETHLGGSLDYSQKDSARRATTQARETVSRAVVKVEQTVRSTRTQRSLSRIEETNTHSLKNEGATPIAGIYRWVDKIERFQVFRYPNRYLLEFQVPEPAAWIRWLYAQNTGLDGVTAEAPQALTVDGKPESENSPRLAPDDISPDNYLDLGARYYAMGLTPPPGKTLVSAALQQDTTNPRDTAKIKENDPVRYLKAADIAVPPGYRARHWYARVHGWGEDAYNAGAVQASILLMIGNADGISVGPDNKSAFGHEGNVQSIGPVEIDGAIVDGTDNNPGYAQTQLPVSLRLDNVRGYNLHITVECEPTEEALAAWRIGTYEKIAEAYFSMKNRRDEQVAAAQVRAGVSIEGNSPERNLQVVREELKKHVVAMLYREPDGSNQTPFKWPRLIQVHPDTGEPSIRTNDAVERAALIQFLEQAFEWEKLTYVCYPYFWADRATQWRTLADLQSADPVFAEFLRAGSARTVVSVRPGFESQVQLFLDFGVIWGGGTAPAPGEENYLSIADEIRAIQRGADDAERLEWWDTRLPTTLLWLDGAGTLPEKPEEQRELGPDPVAP